MKIIETLDDLSLAELDRMYRTLVERFGVGKRGNIREIGFGIAENDEVVNDDRPGEVVFYVKQKCTPRAKRDRIPKCLEVRVKRRNRFVLVRLSTDVVTLQRKSDLVLTGSAIKHSARPMSIATASVLFVWRVSGDHLFQWGVITVGHLFWSRNVIPETTPQVSVLVNGKKVSGTLLMRTQPNDGVDVALVQVERDRMKDVLEFNPPTAAMPIRSINNLKDDQGKTGATKPRNTAIGFKVLRYFPQFHSVPRIGTLFHILKVKSTTKNAFKMGRSGSPWNIANQAACHQIFGWEIGQFRQGGGQSMHYVLRWVQTELAKQNGVPKSKMIIRIVHYL